MSTYAGNNKNEPFFVCRGNHCISHPPNERVFRRDILRNPPER